MQPAHRVFTYSVHSHLQFNTIPLDSIARISNDAAAVPTKVNINYSLDITYYAEMTWTSKSQNYTKYRQTACFTTRSIKTHFLGGI